MITFQGGYSKVTDILPLAIAKELKRLGLGDASSEKKKPSGGRRKKKGR